MGPRHWVRVPKVPLQRPKDEPPIRLLRVPAKAAGAPAKIENDEEEQRSASDEK